MTPLALIALIQARIKRRTRRELRLTRRSLELVRFFAGEIREQAVLEATAYEGCEVVKQRGGKNGPRYLVRIRGEEAALVLGEKHALDQEDALSLRRAIEDFYKN